MRCSNSLVRIILYILACWNYFFSFAQQFSNESRTSTSRVISLSTPSKHQALDEATALSTRASAKLARHAPEDSYQDTSDDEEEPSQTASIVSALAGSRGFGCLWDCKEKQNTTNLLLFRRAKSGEKYDSKFTKETPIERIQRSGFDPSRPTILMIHGFRGHGIAHQRSVVTAKELILSRQRSNVFFADWSHHARSVSYYGVLQHIAEVAEDIFDILRGFEASFPQFSMAKMSVIGHSLGAHVAGLLGQMLHGRLEQITALDPAGFGLNDLAPNVKLSRDDAKYVLAYHTSTKYLGTKMSLADRDVFFNDGITQPACENKGVFTSICSHKEASRYNAAYMGQCIMVAYLCPTYASFLSGKCGYCADKSDVCVGVGHEWQYDASEKIAALLKPTGLNKTGTDIPWDIEGSRYFLKAGPENPYCVYTYQIIVKFPDGSKLTNEETIDLILTFDSDDGGGVRIQLENRLPGKVEVFDDESKRALVWGDNLFSALALVERSSNLYSMMPVKFTDAILPKYVREKMLESETVEVFVNYMSHIRFTERRANSGPVKVSWADMRRPNTKSSRRKRRISEPPEV